MKNAEAAETQRSGSGGGAWNQEEAGAPILRVRGFSDFCVPTHDVRVTPSGAVEPSSMPTVRSIVEIKGPRERCFDLARSIDFHVRSMEATGERAVAGVTGGLIGLGQEVTWEARRLGVTQRLTSRITRFERPSVFVDEQVRGAFRFFRHEHRFEEIGGGGTDVTGVTGVTGVTRVTDVFEFASPLWVLGVVADAVFVRGYMEKLIRGHALRLKAAVESGEWREFLREEAGAAR
jgi:ligand-binding SRPBCC domain-containing protein